MGSGFPFFVRDREKGSTVSETDVSDVCPRRKNHVLRRGPEV